jgi:lycopene beta-cyclase
VTRTDLAVVGAGPAGLALAAAARRVGLAVTVVDPAPVRRWGRTFGIWVDELADGSLASTLAVRHRDVSVIGRTTRRVDREYAVFDTDRLQDELWRRCAGAEVAEARAEGAEPVAAGWRIRTASGPAVEARVAVDCTGAARALLGRPTGPRAEQTAYGVVVDRERSGLGAGEAVFMDWRDDHGSSGPPTFLYALDLGDGTALLEETSLASRPAVPIADLEQRLRARMAARGIALEDDDPVERVRFPLDAPIPSRDGPLGFGAAGGLVHPASGYSVAASLALAGQVAAAVARQPDDGPDAATAAAHRALWSGPARAARAAHRRGLEALLAMPAHLVPHFFDAFFSLPTHRWAPYLAPRPDLAGTLHAMGSVFRAASPQLRRSLARGAAGRIR